MCFLKRPQKMTKPSPSIWHLLHIVKSTVKISLIFVAFLENMNFKEPFQGKFGVKEQFKGDQKVTKIRNNLLTLFNIWVTSKWIKYLQKINLTSISFYVSIKVFTLWPPKFRGLPMPLFQFVFTVYRTIKKSCSTWILKGI